ncbi:MAG: hypothetical protein EP349_05015 [Alphaproteobacteria bacterium]|nr:MAG: hypothetical protein EP349_05015 [Alphaproteobacteria bacterium]
MGVKKSFAQGAREYKEIYFGSWELPPIPLVFSAIVGAAVGFGVTGGIDGFKELDATPQTGQEIAIQQHTAALKVLQEKRDAYRAVQGDAHFIPSPLGNIIDIPEQDQSNQASAVALEENYHSLLNDFVAAVHLDKRLNEQDAKTLVTSFEAAHGAVEDLTNFAPVDYNDLMEARAALEKTEGASQMSAQDQATFINDKADGFADSGLFWGTTAGGAGAPLALAILFAIFGGTLRRWELDQPKPKQKSGFNH